MFDIVEDDNLVRKYVKEFKNDLFKKNKTVVYHTFYGQGVFLRFEKEDVITIKFDSEDEEKSFIFPHSFDDVLFLDKPVDILDYEKNMKDNYYRNQEEQELIFFDKVKQLTRKRLNSYENELDGIKNEFNYYGSDRDLSLGNRYSDLAYLVDLWVRINNNPYFSRIDYYDKNSHLNKYYIGKHEIPGYVISWQDKKSEIYYRYKYYIGHYSKYKLSLLRNFKIILSKYCSHKDVFNIDINKNMIDDSFLEKIIDQRSEKENHDIIETIQENQYNIVSGDETENIIVLGCAGSGKTMILLHRLSYIVFNYNIKPQNVFILSPTNLLNLEMDELSKNLNLNDVHKFTNNTFNKFLLFKYLISSKINFDYNNFNVLIPNVELNMDVSWVYDSSLLNWFSEKLNLILKKESIDNRIFIEHREKTIAQKYSFVINNFEKIEQKLKFYIKILKKINIKNFDVALESLKKEEKAKLGKIVSKKIYMLNKILLKHEKFLSKSSDTFIVNKENEPLKNPNYIFKDLFIFFEEVGIDSCDYDTFVKVFDKKFKELDMCERYLTERMLLDSFVQKNDTNYFLDICKYLLDKVRSYHNISDNLKVTLLEKDDSCFYEYEIFVLVYLCSTIFSLSIDAEKYIFVDEFQDYSLQELKLYRNVFKNSVFNYYGDFNQSLNNKGLNDSDISYLADDDKIFKIRENYRNAKEITEYINDNFGMNMIPLGINGVVRNIKMDDIFKILEVNNEDRLAIIVKNSNMAFSLINNVFKSQNIDLNMIFTGKDKICKDKINILSVNMAKGLEFEKVVVINDDMNKNELYVSYSRALNELYIVDNYKK